MAKTTADLILRLRAQSADLQKGLDTANKQIASFQKQVQQQFKMIGAAVAAAFSIRAISDFLGEAAKMASEVKGVENAFKRITNSEKVLNDLKTATRGTVTELELMKQAIKAENFKIPMDTLAAGLEFATKRAAETGESVDYLVNSFVTGLGRKSILILDNLGISASALNAEVEKTGDFMKAVENITRQELTKMGDVILTDAQKMAQLQANITDAKTELGNIVLKGIMPFIDAGNNLFENLNKQSSSLLKEKESLNILVGAITSATTSEEARSGLIDELNAKYPSFLGNLDTEKVTNEQLTSRLKEVNAEYEKRIELAVLQEDLQDAEESLIKNLHKQRKAAKELVEAQNDLARVQERLNEGQYLSNDALVADVQIKDQLEKRIANLTNRQEKLQEKYGDVTEVAGALREEMSLLSDVFGENTTNINSSTTALETNTAAKERAIETQIKFSKAMEEASLKNMSIPDLAPKKPKQKSILEYFGIDPTKLAKTEENLKAKDDELNEYRKANLEDYAAAATSILDTISTFQDAAMSRELEAAGNNEEKKDAIRKKYARKQQSVAIIQATINGALAVTKAFAELGPIVGQIAAGLVTASIVAQIASMKAQKFATGGIAYGPTLGLVGEYAGARTNPEVIAPLSDLKNILVNTGFGGGQLVARVAGRDLLFVIEEASRVKNNSY